MTDPYVALSKQPEMGMNYLVAADKTVYGLMVWCFGGEAYRDVWRKDHPDYWMRYRDAVLNPYTIFEGDGRSTLEQGKE